MEPGRIREDFDFPDDFEFPYTAQVQDRSKGYDLGDRPVIHALVERERRAARIRKFTFGVFGKEPMGPGKAMHKIFVSGIAVDDQKRLIAQIQAAEITPEKALREAKRLAKRQPKHVNPPVMPPTVAMTKHMRETSDTRAALMAASGDRQARTLADRLN